VSNVRSFWNELRRRHVVRVGIAAEIFLPGLGAPAWVLRTVLGLLVLGLPLAAVMSWAYDITPEGIERAGAHERGSLKGGIATEEERKSIVVLPFDNMSPDPNDAYFSDGLTEEIITQLSYLRSLRVISRSSAMALKNTKKDVRTIGRELNVQYVMEGSVRKAGDSLRITAQLIDANSDEHLWAGTYSRELEDVFELQSEIALSVADAMQASLDARSVERIKSRPTDSLDAHDAYLLGRHHVWTTTEEGMSKAKSYFERALELDPDYASAHCGLAHWCLWAGGAAFSILPAAEAIPRGRAEAKLAITLNPDLGDALELPRFGGQLKYWCFYLYPTAWESEGSSVPRALGSKSKPPPANGVSMAGPPATQGAAGLGPTIVFPLPDRYACSSPLPPPNAAGFVHATTRLGSGARPNRVFSGGGAVDRNAGQPVCPAERQSGMLRKDPPTSCPRATVGAAPNRRAETRRSWTG
jgi:TolB-like protein